MNGKLVLFGALLALIGNAAAKTKYDKDENLDGLFSGSIGKKNHYDDIDEDEEDDELFEEWYDFFDDEDDEDYEDYDENEN